MHFQVLTIFPELFERFLTTGLVGRGRSDGRFAVECADLRDFAVNAHGQIDDTPYGGGSGMVLRVDAATAAIEAAKARAPQAKVVLFTPRGVPLTQPLARRLAKLCSSPRLAKRLGRSAARRANALFTWCFVASSIAALYEDVESGRPANERAAAGIAAAA